MTEERWQRIHEVFQGALEQPAVARPAYLDRLCAGDPELRREVESLLAASTKTGRFDRLVERFDAANATAEAMPARIGPYRIVQELGRGGMGVVYLAEREDDQLGRVVALKVLPTGPTHDDLVGRFLAERRILARLEHPHIARLLFGGVTEEGAPYFAMEYVEGALITAYCDARCLGINDRLRLFLDVCAAVQHAHRRLVVHRDLKPSNMLVTPRGEVKLLDFGIAKLINPDPSGLLDETPLLTRAPRTRTGLRLMTPEYASPEQVRGEPVTTATDVYQLGVVLYELLAGRRPYRLPGRLLHEVERIICEEVPERPSTTVTQRDEGTLDRASTTPEDAARVRATTVDRLRRRLSGDLDTIVLMAMRKEPERRYASPEALADDLRRHLDRLPVRARPDTPSYRMNRFVRRHRVGVAVAALIGVLVVGFGVAMAMQAGRIARERDRAAEATAFVIGLFEDFDPVAAQGSTVSTRSLLDERAIRIRAELQAQPLLQASLLDALGRIYRLRGHYPEAESLLRLALDLRLDHLGPRHLDVAESRYHLGLILSEKDMYVEAESLLLEALATYRRTLAPDDPRLTLALEELAIVYRTRGDPDRAEALFRELLATYRAAPDDRAADLATALLFLGKIQMEGGRYDEATPLLNEAYDVRRGLFGERHPAVANALDGLGELMHARGDYPGAERYYRSAYAIRRVLFEEGHTDLAASLANLGTVLHDQGRYAEAEPLLREVLAIVRLAFGAQHGLATDALYYLGSGRAAREDWEAADSLLTASLATWRLQWSDVGHPMLAGTLELLGRVRRERGDRAAADSLLRRAQAMRRVLASAPSGFEQENGDAH